MLTDVLLVLVAGLAVTSVGLLIALLRKSAADPVAPLVARLEYIERSSERTEGVLREELAKSREESAQGAHHLREEITGSLDRLSESNQTRLTELRGTVDTRLHQIFEQSGKKLDEMRQTVDEKLQGTLEKRLGEAFQQVSERLEAVHQGLGEMQNLANGVGDLKKALTNVKTRGTFGEIALGDLLEQILAPEQYERNVAIRSGSAERVDFAIRFPGRDDDEQPLWLPIDAKFPLEDYHRLIEAQETGDLTALEVASRALESRIKAEAKSIREKYLNPPRTTDFAILFLPTEGLYAEVLRRPGLGERLQRDHQIVVAGPMTLAAMLNSFRMGFRTLAIQKRSGEVWQTLGAVKTQFGAFTDLLEKVQGKLDQASKQIENASAKGRYIQRRLSKVEELPAGEAAVLLPLQGDASDDA